MTLQAAEVEDRVALLAAVAGLPAAAADLLGLLVLIAPIGEPLPDRVRRVVEQDAAPLWRAGLLLPWTQPQVGVSLLPSHYSGRCRVNPCLAPWRPELALGGEGPALIPPTDARWDAVVLAAVLEAAPAIVNQDESLRKDVERRLGGVLGGDAQRCRLALAWGQAAGLLRISGGRLLGYPEAVPRPVSAPVDGARPGVDPAGLFVEPERSAAAALLRLVGEGWISEAGLLAHLHDHAREVLYSPQGGAYPQSQASRFDAAGWEAHEAACFAGVLDSLCRARVLERSPTSVRRRPPDDPSAPLAYPGFLLTSDLEILVHIREIDLVTYGRLSRLAPFTGGDQLRRHRLSREGIVADLAFGHEDPVLFLERWSRTGVPPHVADVLREWRRSGARITICSGVDLLEDADGIRRLAGPAPVGARIVDYARERRPRFTAEDGELRIATAEDDLVVRAAVLSVAELVGVDSRERRYRPRLQVQGDAATLLARLRGFHEGPLPGELETRVLSAVGTPPLRVTAARLLSVPSVVADALRKDPLLRAHLVMAGHELLVVRESEWPAVSARLLALGLRVEAGDESG